jgi:hypothetical protein
LNPYILDSKSNSNSNSNRASPKFEFIRDRIWFKIQIQFLLFLALFRILIGIDLYESLYFRFKFKFKFKFKSGVPPIRMYRSPHLVSNSNSNFILVILVISAPWVFVDNAPLVNFVLVSELALERPACGQLV